MSVKVDLDSPAFTLKSKIQEVSKDFLETFGLNYFQYLLCFAEFAVFCRWLGWSLNQ